MASVSGSDSSSRSNEEVRRNREDYDKAESDMVKKHQKEIRRLNDEHAREVEGLKSTHAKQIAEMQRQSRDNMTERDQKYQGEIENIRNLHRKQIQTNADENQKREGLLKGTIQSEREAQKMQGDVRVTQLQDDTKKEIKEQEGKFKQGLDENREAQMRGMAEQRQKLDKAHNDDLESTKKDLNTKIANLQNEYRGYRKDSENRIRGQEQKHFEDNARQSDNMLRAVGKERQERADAEANWKSGDNVRALSEHYEKGMEQNRESLDKARQNMEDDYHGHVSAEMRQLRDENSKLRDDNIRNERLSNQNHVREMNHFREAYTKNIENYKMQRDETLRTGNEKRKHDIEDLRTKDDQMIMDNNRSYQEKMDDQNRRLKTDYRNMNNDFKARNEEIQGMADARVLNIVSQTEDEKQRMIKNQQEGHDTMRRQAMDEIKNIRTQNETERSDSVERVKELARQNDLTHTQKMIELQQKHQREVIALQDQLMHERKNNEDGSKRLMEEMARAHKTDMDQQTMKYEQRIRELQNQQSEEIRRLNRASEERMQQLASVQARKT